MTIYFGDGSSQGAAGLSGAGKVLQVKEDTMTGINSSYSQSWTDTDLQIAITPSSSSSKIYIAAMVNASCQSTMLFRIVQSSNVMLVGAGSDPCMWASHGETSPQYYGYESVYMSYLDSPSTTSSITYKVQYRNTHGNNYPIYLGRCVRNGDTHFVYTTPNKITVMEVSG